jgi:hypothetical protein
VPCDSASLMLFQNTNFVPYLKPVPICLIEASALVLGMPLPFAPASSGTRVSSSLGSSGETPPPRDT